jgi:hypothetical protein
MQRTIRRLAALALLAAAGRASASPYYLMFGVATQERAHFYDAGSVIKQGDRVTFWMMTRVNQMLFPQLPYESMTRIEINCARQTLQYLALANYDYDGTVKEESNRPGDVEQIVPDTKGAGFMRVVCDPGFPLTVADTVKVDDVRNAAKKVFTILKPN